MYDKDDFDGVGDDFLLAFDPHTSSKYFTFINLNIVCYCLGRGEKSPKFGNFSLRTP